MNDQTGINQKVLPTWDKIEPKKEQLKWKTEESKTVVFLEDEPEQIDYKDGKFFVFSVEENQKPKTIATSSFSMLQGLKAYSPLSGKVLKITKQAKNGKQYYQVEDASEVEK